ncbi:sensor domain-containing diguanylate cyclase [Iodobacter ciconiae]|uniref:Sensor domain-containing diguanylate cyclase n=1 Tax=Iodobacter ciconiae TaxID=2496266 RepID=A0A3S8ZT90_9NEIS|nr:sensor domain-containing diguanylate cyclase [Iodobacter ciconiae]AZN36676.1 sensor domain-containing diguanylate cyclase [Iodobacter ciconiae]
MEKSKVQNLPLAKKLLLLNVVGIATTLLVCLALFSISYTYIAVQRLKSEAMVNANILAANIAPILVFNDQKAARILAHSFVGMPDLVYLGIVNAQNQIFTDWRSLHRKYQLSSVIHISNHPQTDMYLDHITVWAPVLLDGELLGTVQLQIGFDSVYRSTMQFFLLGLALMAIAIIIASLILNRLQVRALAPIFELSSIAENVALLRDYSLRSSYISNNELGRLSFHFNQMLAKIEKWENDIKEELNQSKESERYLDLLANYDNLTQLANRHYFHQALAATIGRTILEKQFSALIFIDLDNFKYVNDHYGHEAGDLVLTIIAQRLKAILRSTDIPCRLGGDEFAAILPQIADVEVAKMLAGRLVAGVKQEIIVHGKVMPVGASIGIACCPLHAEDPKTLLHYADLAMYQAKKAGKNTFCVYSEKK